MQKLVKIGFIKTSHGLKGELELKLLYSDLNFYDYINETIFLYNVHSDIYEDFFVEKVFMKKHNYVIKIKNLNNINESSKYKMWDLYIPKIWLNDLKWFQNIDILGFKVKDSNSNAILGIVSSVDTQTSNYIICIKNNDKEILIPYVDKFVKKIQYDAKTIYLDMIEGL